MTAHERIVAALARHHPIPRPPSTYKEWLEARRQREAALWRLDRKLYLEGPEGVADAERKLRRQKPYGGFTEYLKAQIRERDGHECTCCGASPTPGHRAFHVHHIDEDKSNCDPSNLTTLCPTCHGEAKRLLRWD